MESLPHLDELLVSSFDPDISDNEEEVGAQENADSLGLEPYRFEPFLSGTNGKDSESKTVTITLALAVAATERALTP